MTDVEIRFIVCTFDIIGKKYEGIEADQKQ